MSPSNGGLWVRFRDWAAQLKSELIALWFCTRHPRAPLAAKALATIVVAYAFSPIDLIPDFIPVIGYLDDLLLLPAGLWLALKLVPPDVIAECRERAARWQQEGRPRPRLYAGAALIAAIWLAMLWLAWRWSQEWLAG